MPELLTTRDAVKAWLGEAAPSDNDTIDRLIEAASGVVRQYLNRDSLLSRQVNELYSGVGSAKLMLRQFPVTAIASLSVDGVPIRAASSTLGAGYRFDSWDGYSPGTTSMIVLNGYAFHRGHLNIEVSYTAGYPSVPADIENACLGYIAFALSTRDVAPGVASIKAGDTQIVMERSGRIGNLNPVLPMAVAAALAPYRRVAPI